MNTYADVLPKIVITSGEPAGIGPDLCVKLSQSDIDARLIVLCNKDLLLQRANRLDALININDVTSLEDTVSPHVSGQLNVLSIPLNEDTVSGELNQNNAQYVIQQLELATDACLSGAVDAMVTGPVHKGIINQAGISFTGHTEYLAEQTKSELPVMMLQTPGLRVALLTTHVPLKDVPAKLTSELLNSVLSILHQDLVNKYGITDPHIMVCGLNPHAGENGYLGTEEINIMEPVIKACQDKGMCIEGPLSADTIFSKENLANADVFLAMYHDQGLPVIKYKGFGETVNVTLGLPIIRTSVDHGTALALAGTGEADVNSFLHAIQAAIDLASYRH